MLEEGTRGERTLTTQDEPTPGMRMGQDREDRLPLTCCHLTCHLVPRVESAQPRPQATTISPGGLSVSVLQKAFRKSGGGVTSEETRLTKKGLAGWNVSDRGRRLPGGRRPRQQGGSATGT